jgi:hypothetical protein
MRQTPLPDNPSRMGEMDAEFSVNSVTSAGMLVGPYRWATYRGWVIRESGHA